MSVSCIHPYWLCVPFSSSMGWHALFEQCCFKVGYYRMTIIDLNLHLKHLIHSLLVLLQRYLLGTISHLHLMCIHGTDLRVLSPPHQVADALAQPFSDNSFDLVWSMESGEHMPDKK